METIYMNTKNSKVNEQHKFVLNLPQRLDLKNSNMHVALQTGLIFTAGKIWDKIAKT